MSAHNSISQLLEQFLELNTNSLETFNRINEAITTDKETVTVDLYNPNDSTLKSVQIPAFGYLKREIERLNNNLESISGVEDGTSTVRLKDGSFRKIFTNRLKGPSKPVTSISAPTQFNTKLNEFFEDFLNPLLTIKLDISGQIPVETEKVYVERFIFNNEDPATIDKFEESYKGTSELDYAKFKSDLADGGLVYYLDSEVIEMPIRTIQYYGSFDVAKISNEQRSQVVDGVTQTKTIKLFTLNKLSYSDSTREIKDTEILKINDSLVVNSGELKTRYIVKSIDSSTSQVELELMEGYEAIKIGANQLSIYKDVDSDLEVEINVGFDERQVIFIKPIDPDSNIPANEYSPGIGFYSNELVINGAGSQITLAEYYRTEVADFGQFIKSLKVDYIPPAAVGIKPASPAVSVQNLKVVQVNKHLTDNTTTQKITQLKSDKISAEQRIKNLDQSIKDKKELLNTRKFKSTIERDKQRNELRSLTAERESESKLYASVVSDIKTSAESTGVKNVDPKFRVRGFWSIPEPRTIGNQVSQEVVQFKIRYRYASTSGKTSQVEQIEFSDAVNGTTKTAAFSNWIEVAGPVRKRQMGESGKFEWVTESEEDAQAVNFNSLDLAISPGEVIEIMVKSISEAGFPSNPVESDWSDIVKVEFPEGELSIDSLGNVLASNDLDKLRVDIDNDLNSAGVYQHISDAFETGDKYFSHNATSIASGFLTAEQSPVSVYDKLIELQNEIARLKATIEGAIGELEVRIIDEDGNVTNVTNNSTVNLFAGYYVNELPDTNYKGHIVTKNFKIELSNTKATNLELIARIIGDTEQPAFVSTTNQLFGLGTGSIATEVLSNTYYTTEAKYDLVPLMYQNLDQADVANIWFNNGSQSSQLRGQFIYSRYQNLSNDDSLYLDIDPDAAEVTGLDKYVYGLSYTIAGVSNRTPSTGVLSGSKDYSSATFTPYLNNGVAGTDFIWTGDSANQSDLVTLATITNSKYDNGILLHTNHPEVSSGKNALELQSNGLAGAMPKVAVLRANDSRGKKQVPFRRITTLNDQGNPSILNTYKNSFNADDQYLLGGHSCGSFLYLAPLDKNSLIVDAKNKSGKKIVPGGKSNSIIIDMVFEYRMTDYFGPGDTGSGRVGGVIGNTFTNLSYSKKIGIDIIDSQNNDFTFDVEVYAKYKPTGKNINSITSSMLTNYNASGGSSVNSSQYFTTGVDFSSPTISPSL